MILKTTFAFISIFILSCGPIQNQPQEAETNSPAEIEAKKIESNKMIASGYLPGRIIYSDFEGDCEYTVQLKDGDREFYYVDPINLEENFKRDGQTIWLKFNGLRRMNRCENANPVEITEIMNRDE